MSDGASGTSSEDHSEGAKGDPQTDASRGDRLIARVRLRVPIIVMVLAATAVPIELRPPTGVPLGFGIFFSDALANVAGYIPVGLVLGESGPVMALLAAVGMAALAETGQFVMMHRDPSVIDLGANAFGAFLGILIREGLHLRSPELVLGRWRGFAAAILALALITGAWATSASPLHDRGTTSPGTLEAHWKFDEASGNRALDSSGRGLWGTFSGAPGRVPGVLGRAVKLDGAADYVDFGRSTSLRLVGSMTISAWINSSSFPIDDAAIVSSHNGLGYQLDTTVDRGPRTIGFKLADACGHLMARYGATPLVAGRWYHVAGVYDAGAQTLDVYLNGERDDGFLLGAVSSVQRSSRERVYVGRRSDFKGAEFGGSIDDVRIYSRPLTDEEIAADMDGTVIPDPGGRAAAGLNGDHRAPTKGDGRQSPCLGQSDIEDARLPGMAVVLGVLVAVACTTLWPWAGPLVSCVASLSAGAVLVVVTMSSVPWLGRCLIPLTSLAGAASVVAGRSRHTRSD